MTNSDNTYGTHNKQTSIIAQPNVTETDPILSADGSTYLGDGDSTVRPVTPASITLNNPIRVVVSREHGITDSSKVTFADVVGTTELNGKTYFAKKINATTIDLYSDRALSTTVDGGGSFTAYADDDSGQITFVLAKTVFANTNDAINYFFTDDAQAVMNETCTTLQWALVDDDDSLATSLKRTFEFGVIADASAEQWAEAYNRRMKALQDADGWGQNIYTTTASDSHLF
tara:strand:- start:71 stop:760 length:690 start_codon:yes stop_codon:yes gene_type:complete